MLRHVPKFSPRRPPGFFFQQLELYRQQQHELGLAGDAGRSTLKAITENVFRISTLVGGES